MREFKIAFKILVRQYVSLWEKLRSCYIAAAASGTLLFWGFWRLSGTWIVPAVLLKTDKTTWLESFDSISPDIIATTLVAIGLGAVGITVFTAHRKTQITLNDLIVKEKLIIENKKHWSNSKTSATITLTVLFLLAVGGILCLPLLVLLLGQVAFAQSVAWESALPQPWWIHLSVVGFSFLAFLSLLFSLLFIRITFSLKQQ